MDSMTEERVGDSGFEPGADENSSGQDSGFGDGEESGNEQEGGDTDPFDLMSPDELKAEAKKWKNSHTEATRELTRKSMALSQREQAEQASRTAGKQQSEEQLRGEVREIRSGLAAAEYYFHKALAAGGQIEVSGQIVTSDQLADLINAKKGKLSEKQDMLDDLRDAPRRQITAQAQIKEETLAAAKELGFDKYANSAAELAGKLAEDPVGLGKLLVYAAIGMGLKPRDGTRPRVLEGKGRKGGGDTGRSENYNDAAWRRIRERKAKLKR